MRYVVDKGLKVTLLNDITTLHKHYKDSDMYRLNRHRQGSCLHNRNYSRFTRGLKEHLLSRLWLTHEYAQGQWCAAQIKTTTTEMQRRNELWGA